MPKSEGVGDHRVGVKDTEICRLPKATVGQILKRGASEWGAEDECSYFELSYVPIVNKVVCDAVGVGEADIDVIVETAASGLLFTDDDKVQQAFLVVLGTAENLYDGDNYLTGGATKNIWQLALGESPGAGDWVNLNPNGNMANGSWRAIIQGVLPSFPFEFHITSQLTDVDAKLNLRIKSALAAQDSFLPEISAGLKILWKG
jgi:hypothetical protein